MPYSIEDIQRLSKLLEGPNVSPAVRAKVEETIRAQQAAELEGPGVTEDSLDPNLSLPAQVHATMPKATGEAAVDPQGALERSQGKGVVFFYEPTKSFVQQKMMDDAYLKALGEPPPTPEEIQNAAPGMPLYDRIADEEFRKAGSAADAAGKTGYRVSREPWFGSDKAGVLDRLKSFGTRLQAQAMPAIEGAQAFVLGLDDTATFGAAQNAAVALDSVAGAPAEARRATGPGSDEYVQPGQIDTMTGEGSELSTRQVMDRTRANNPELVAAGQVLGAFTPWGLTNRLANYVTRGIRTALPSAAGIPLAAASGATTGVTIGGARLATDVAGQSAEAGQLVPPTPEAVGNAAMEGPLGAGFGVGGEAVGQVAGGIANNLRRARFPGVQPGAIGDLEQVGDLNISTLGGVKPTPRAQEMVDEGFRARANPVNVSAEKLTPKMLETVNAEREALKAESREAAQQFNATPEGRTLSVPKNYVNRVKELLGKHTEMSAERGVIEATGGKGSPGEELINRFNADVVDGVSLKPPSGRAEKLSSDESRALSMLAHPGSTSGTSGVLENTATKSALEKSRVDGPGTLYKGMKLSPDLQAQIESGKVKFGDYSSTTRDADYAAGYTQGGVLVEVNGAPRAHTRSDREMLLPPGEYRVTGRETRNMDVGGGRKQDVQVVKVEPVEGAAPSSTLELTPEQAEGWLNQTWQKRALPEKLPKSKHEAELDKKLGTDKEPEGFAAKLKAQGVEKVYVIPKRRDAMKHEALIDHIEGWQVNPSKPMKGVLGELDAAMRADRAARSPEFDARMKALSDKRTEYDTMVSRTAGHGNPQRGEPELQLTRSLSSFGSGAVGSKPTDDALRGLADKAGMRPDLEAHGSLDPMLRLSEASRFRTGGTGVLSELRPRLQVFDPLAIRSFPAARALGTEATSPIRQGRAARATALDIPASLRGIDSSDALIRAQLQQPRDEETK